jgi:hypothetical protein
MWKRFSLVMVVGLLALSLPLAADIVTKKFEWAPVAGVQKVSFDWNDIAISEIRFDLGDTVAPIRYSSTKAVVRVDNNSRKDQEVGVAVAIFAADGTMLAAGSGGIKLGDLDKGERQEFTVKFPYVYRNLKEAATFLVTLETKDVGKTPRTRRAAASHSTESSTVQSEKIE